MRPFVAAAAVASLAHCAQWTPDDSSAPVAYDAADASPMTLADRKSDAESSEPRLIPFTTGAAQPPARPPQGKPSPSADAAPAPAAPSAKSSALVVDGAAPRCIQATPATPPPPVAAGPAPGCPPDPGGDTNAAIVRVTFPGGDGATVDAELAATEQAAERGLMYRTSMPVNHGMLFDMQVRGQYQFWMHDTCIPLDMVFADVDGLIVGIIENAPPLDDTPRGVGCPSRYVLEVNAGWTRDHGVKAGQQMTIPAGA
jgi:uncharacterized membrane protein (UPF0127 family)